MTAFALFLHFPVAVWTVLVAISLVYWLFVMSGLVHLGEGADGGAEGLGHGGDLHAGHAEIGDAGDAADGGVQADGGHELGASEDAPAGIAGFFRLKDVPITVSFSLISFFSWILTLVALWASHQAHYDPGLLVKALLAFVVAPLVAFPLTKAATRPLAPLLTPRRAKSSRDLLGQTCTIRTGEADERFGEALVKDTGAEIVLRVRVEGVAMKRGEEGVIVGFDEEREEYIVAPIEEASSRRRS